MTYANQTISHLLRGPLLHIPQGWVVLAATGVYFTLALLCLGSVVAPPPGKDLSSVLVVCFSWPFVTFLIFVKHNLPDFVPSWSRASFVAIWAFAPIAYAIVRG